MDTILVVSNIPVILFLLGSAYLFHRYASILTLTLMLGFLLSSAQFIFGVLVVSGLLNFLSDAQIFDAEKWMRYINLIGSFVAALSFIFLVIQWARDPLRNARFEGNFGSDRMKR